MASQTAPSATYIDLLTRRLRDSGAAPVLTYRGRAIGADTFLALIHRYARALAAMGVDRASVVALLAPNAPDAIAVRYAANLLGAATCYLSAPPTTAARAALIRQIAPTLLVVLPDTLRLLPPGIKVPTVAVGHCGQSFARLDAAAAGQSGEPLDCLARPDDLAVIVSSGGSTGVPKGSCRDFAHYTGMAAAPSPPDRRQLVNGHLAYLSEVLVDMTLIGGGSVVLRDEFDAADTLAQIQAERITDLFLVEPQLFALMDHPAVPATDLSSLRTLVHIGASAPPVLRRRARLRLGPVVMHTYGASEQGLISPCSLGTPETAPEAFTSAGRVLPGVRLRLCRPDGGLAAPGEPGIIETASPGMAQGYRNQPELTARAFRDGWFHSGDLGRLDRDGFLQVLGRAEDVAQVGTRLVTPTGIEDTLCRLPSVRYAVVVPDPEHGCRVAAVEAWPGGTVEEAGCRQAVAASYGAEVAASLVLAPVGSVPLTEQGKPDRAAIKELAPPPAPATGATAGVPRPGR
ncbi:MAG: AMP-binding protein [Geminicoccaceae bacterium]